MIFSLFTVANNDNFGAQWPNGRRVFLPTNKTFEGNRLALSGKFRQKDCEFSFYLKPFCKKKNIKSSFKLIFGAITLNKVTQDWSLICICKQKTFAPISSVNWIQTEKALPVETFKPTFVTFFVYFGSSLFDYLGNFFVYYGSKPGSHFARNLRE